MIKDNRFFKFAFIRYSHENTKRKVPCQRSITYTLWIMWILSHEQRKRKDKHKRKLSWKYKKETNQILLSVSTIWLTEQPHIQQRIWNLKLGTNLWISSGAACILWIAFTRPLRRSWNMKSTETCHLDTGRKAIHRYFCELWTRSFMMTLLI